MLWTVAVALVGLSWHWTTGADAACDPRLPHCREQQPSPSSTQCKPVYLIPGKANDCSRPDGKKLITIDPNSVSITPNPIKLPGCFTISMKVQIANMEIPKSFFAKIEYNWWNLPQFSNLPCQNASANGCGGYGNNCYYCDICDNLQKVNRASTQSAIVSQVKNISCPDKPGLYEISRQFCFNDFSELDKNHNCQFDFVENHQAGKSYNEALHDLKNMGYGTVTAKFTLAHNATPSQAIKKTEKEAEIRRKTEAEVATKRKNWAVDEKQYGTFLNWYTQNRLDTWHKQEYLPYILYYNQMGCMTTTFSVCDKPPTQAGSSQCG